VGYGIDVGSSRIVDRRDVCAEAYVHARTVGLVGIGVLCVLGVVGLLVGGAGVGCCLGG
jgi:hypothetical protein